jgi:Zn-dependent M28 family amino/carboxypeptidase
LLECVRVEGVREHQLALQRIADANGGNRFSGFPGYDASVDYVVRTLRAAGYDPEVQAFDYLAYQVLGPSALQQVAPNAITYVEGVDFGAVTQSDAGDVTAAVTPVDLQWGLGNTSTSGCQASDFAGFPAGNIALLQRGDCTFEMKAENAAAAGAVGIVIFNQGNTTAADRNGIPAVTLTANNTSGIPVIGTTYALGVTLASTPGLRMRVFANTLRRILPTYNVLAEKTGTNDDNVVMAGAHLDSVLAGPGINDNGSGSAAILETAIQMAKLKTTNTVRFAWWGAEESGLVGSTNYVNGLSQAEKDRIALYLNFDMIGSPNYIQMVYDSDQSGFAAPVPVPPGSIAIEDLFESFYTLRNEPYDDAEFSGRSDYQAFILNGIPAGGLFTGAEVPKTAAQQAIWGGTAGAQYDPCYHAACDTIVNINDTALDQMSDAAAHATITLAQSTVTVNGKRGKGNFKPKPSPEEAPSGQ